MIMSLLFHVVSAWFAFLLPCFSTYKALARHSEQDIERWSMYWTIIGALVGFEYLFEWIISWFPFYWEVKTMLLLFLALPQTEGSTWLYKSYLEPFFIENEATLDSGIVAAQSNVLTFLQARLAALWDLLWSIINKTPSTAQGANGSPTSESVPSPLDTAQQLFSTYAPGIFGALVRPPTQSSPVASNVSQRSASSIHGYDAHPPFPEPQLH